MLQYSGMSYNQRVAKYLPAQTSYCNLLNISHFQFGIIYHQASNLQVIVSKVIQIDLNQTQFKRKEKHTIPSLLELLEGPESEKCVRNSERFSTLFDLIRSIS